MCAAQADSPTAAGKTPGSLVYRLAITAGVLIVYRLGCHIPLPGLSAPTVSQVFGIGGTAVERISIFALGIGPLVGILILAELLKILVPGFRRWENADPRNATWLRGALIALALLAAAVQAAGLAGALENVTGLVDEPGTYFRAMCTATLVAGTALIIALARVISRDGVGSGIWIIFLAPALAELPQHMSTLFSAYVKGDYPLLGIILSVAFMAIAIAAVVSLLLAGSRSPAVGSACIWPMLITYAALPWILIAVGLIISGGDIDAAAAFVAPPNTIHPLVLAAIVGLAVFLYARSNRLAGTPLPMSAAPIGVVLTAIAIAAAVLPTLGVPIPLGSGQLVIAAVVATSVLSDWGMIRRLEGSEPPESPSEPLSPRA